MNKGQLFSMDAFLSIVGITLILGIFTAQLSIFYNSYDQNIYERLDSIASDMANIAVANIMAKSFEGVKRTAVVDEGKVIEFKQFLSSTLGNDYGGFVRFLGKEEQINDGCDSEEIQAVERRLILAQPSGKVGWFEVGICYA